MAAADFCTVTARIAAGRAVLLDDVAAVFFDTQRAARHGAWVLVSRLNRSGLGHHPVAPHAVQISPGKNANVPCASAAFTMPTEPKGFVVMCQLAPQAWPFMRFLFVASHFCTRASSRQDLAGCGPCRRLVVKIALYESNLVLPQGTFTP